MKVHIRIQVIFCLLLFIQATSHAQRSELILQTGHSAGVTSVAFSPDGKLLASSSEDKTIKLWETATGAELRTLAGHSSIVKAVAFSPDGKLLASGGEDKAIKLWDIVTGKELRVISSLPITSVTFSPDSNLLLSGSRDSSITVLDLSLDNAPRILKGHSDSVECVTFSPDGRLMASGSADNMIKIWDVATGSELNTLTGGGIFNQGVNEDSNRKDWLIVTPDGTFDGTVVARKSVLWRFENRTFDVASLDALSKNFHRSGLLNDILSGKDISGLNVSLIDHRPPHIKLKILDRPLATSKPNFASTVKLKIEVREAAAEDNRPAGGVRDVHLFRNGSLIKVWHGKILLSKSGDAILETTIALGAGENRITAYAFNGDNTKSSDAKLTLMGADNLDPKGTVYIVAVGINKYANPGFNLSYAVPDANAFASELKQAQIKLSSYSKVEVISLFDQDATKNNILTALGRLGSKEQLSLPPGSLPILAGIKPARPQDAVIIYFGCHGIEVESHFYLIPHNFRREGKDFLTSGISDEELRLAFESIDAGQLALITDVSHSGFLLEADDMVQLAKDKDMYILVSSQSGEETYESVKLGHGYLTYALLEGLVKEEADTELGDGKVTLPEWLEYALKRVPNLVSSEVKNRQQTPVAFYNRVKGNRPLVVSAIESNKTR